MPFKRPGAGEWRLPRHRNDCERNVAKLDDLRVLNGCAVWADDPARSMAAVVYLPPVSSWIEVVSGGRSRRSLCKSVERAGNERITDIRSEFRSGGEVMSITEQQFSHYGVRLFDVSKLNCRSATRPAIETMQMPDSSNTSRVSSHM